MPYGMCYVHVLSVGIHLFADGLVLHSYQAWASVLLVQLYRAMREPLCVERVTVRTPHAFFVCVRQEPFYLFVWVWRVDGHKTNYL